ncbi:MAG TPA: hypothetical protein VFV19_12430 [Candidatus Polarisedimenticolaceae bacterium]|nr:hypothetical protein [Candidatus Polarisedimenticolaceae bacterium]
MKGHRIACALAIVAVTASTRSWAGPYADDLAKCLVKSTTAADKSKLVQWMFAMSSLHPDVKQLSAVSPEKRTELNKQFAGMLTTLLTQSCLNETRDALNNEGPQTLAQGFTVLGQVAGRELFSNPEVAAGMNDLEGMFDNDKLEAALKTKK